MYAPYMEPGYANMPMHRLAVHETLELHELLAFKTAGLMKMKKTVHKISDPQLRQIYLQTIPMVEQEMGELIQLLQNRPVIS